LRQKGKTMQIKPIILGIALLSACQVAVSQQSSPDTQQQRPEQPANAQDQDLKGKDGEGKAPKKKKPPRVDLRKELWDIDAPSPSGKPRKVF